MEVDEAPRRHPLVPRILFVVDSTGSMSNYLNALRDSLQQLVPLSKLLYAGKLEFGVIEYRDYCDKKVIESFLPFTADGDEVSKFVKRMTANGGGDIPEALKTALNRAIDEQMLDDRTLVIIYTDAPPHTVKAAASFKKSDGYDNPVQESKTVKIFDWVQLCAQLIASGAVFTSVISTEVDEDAQRFFTLLGDTIMLANTETDTITRTTVHLVAQRASIPSDIDVRRQERPTSLPNASETEATCAWLNKEAPSAFAWFKTKVVKTEAATPTAPMEPIGAFATSLMKMAKRFQTVAEYRELVLDVFGDLVSSLKGVRSLTYNKVFGTLWREICKLRDDERRVALINLVSKHAAADAAVAKWLEESYNRIEQVEEDIKEAPEAFPALVLPAACAGALTQKDVLALARSCDYNSVAAVMALLTRVQVAHNKGTDGAESRMLPQSLTPSKLFELIPHLLLPGMTYGRRPAAIVAMLALHGRIAPLVDAASALVEKYRGSWLTIDPTNEKSEKYPENFSADAIGLFYKLREHLTDEERFWVEKLRRLVRLRQNLSARIECQRPTRASQMQHDYKMECSSCTHVRSLTLFTATKKGESAKCGLCEVVGIEGAKNMPELDGTALQIETAVGGAVENPSEPKVVMGLSHMVSCRKCLARYAVVNVDRLKCSPKCHACRLEEKPRKTFLDCSLCCTRYACASASLGRTLAKNLGGTGGPFVCAECKFSGKGRRAANMEQTTELVIREHIALVAPLIGFDISANSELEKTLLNLTAPIGSLFAMRAAATAFGEPKQLEKTGLDPMPCRFLDYQAALERMATQIREGAIVDDCLLCCEATPLHKLLPACGRCPVRTCEKCVSAWYGSSTPGNVLVPGSTICPFCKQSPKFDVLRRANKQLCMLLGLKVRFEAGIIYAWCVECNKAAPLMAAECARAEATPDLQGKFRCAVCVEAERAEKAARRQQSKADEELVKKRYMSCPGCKTPTEKEFGCNHISCPCGVHWCFECGEGMHKGQDIYSHMYEAHGSIGY